MLLLVIDPQLAFARLHTRVGHIERIFERRAFLSQVASVFDALDCTYLEHIPADGEPDQIAAIITERVRIRLGLG